MRAPGGPLPRSELDRPWVTSDTLNISGVEWKNKQKRDCLKMQLPFDNIAYLKR